jgi:hypothetical protein
MPVLLCDLASMIAEVRLDREHERLRLANGGHVAVAEPEDLRDDAFAAFQGGRIGESEYARHLRARLHWRGSDATLVDIFADLYGSVDVAVMELLVELRAQGWFLVGLDQRPPWRRDRASGWGGQYAEQLTVFHRVCPVAPRWPVPVQHGELAPTDPRFFARVLRDVPPAQGPRLFAADRVESVAAARTAGLDAHLYRGASGLRAACLALVLTA